MIEEGRRMPAFLFLVASSFARHSRESGIQCLAFAFGNV